MHYFLIAGEASGDLHGAELIRSLKALDPQARFTIVGGDRMADASGASPLLHIRDLAIMGFSAVILNLPRIMRNIRTVRRAVIESRPDALILIDYPSFNLKIAKTAHAAGIPSFYYIPPKVWAWKAWRVRRIRALITCVYAIFPFEPAFYASRGADAVYVGNPSVPEVDAALAAAPSREQFYALYRLPLRRAVVALMPGSRVAEIRSNLPVMIQAMDRFPQYRPVIAGAPNIPDDLYASLAPGIPVCRTDSAVDLLANSAAALVTSGTATLETALAGIPQVAMYRANGSKISYSLMKKLLNVSYVTLPNLILGREAIPELLLHQCTPEAVANALTPLLSPALPQRTAQEKACREIRRVLGTSNAPDTAAADIVAKLNPSAH